VAASTITLSQADMPLSQEWRGRVGMWCLIAAESAIFSIFVVAYLYYAGKSLSGPTPRQVLEVPIFTSICLFSSSLTISLAVRSIARGRSRAFGLWWALTIALGLIFILGTAREWYSLIYEHGLTISSSLFGTTFYSLVGLHAFHVIVGLLGLSIIMTFGLLGLVKQEHAERIEVFSLYWHFVDAIWVVVLTVVYFVAR
jgi:cytochrome c oxidase subunit 3/cytochrome o ubiquinol oxidase subunit 3